MPASPVLPMVRVAVEEPVALAFLHRLATLLVRYNVRAALLERQLQRVADVLGVELTLHTRYRGATLFSASGRHYNVQVPELRINVAVSAEANRLINRFCSGAIGFAETERSIASLEDSAFRHGRWTLAVLFGLAAAALAWLLRADPPAAAVSGLASALGLFARQALAKRHPVLFALPFTAALIGAILGALVIRAGWTATPGYCLMVPALMLVPGPHLINGLYDIIDNHIATGLARLTLACGVLIAAGAGVFLGGSIVLGMVTVAATPSAGVPLTFALDVVLAGAAACGFAAFYNAPWRVLWISVLCGMVGHGVRYLLLKHGVTQEVATLWACLPIGFVANVAVARIGVPFASVAFAGAVPMMPGTLIYQALEAAMRLAAGPADPLLAAQALQWSFKSAFVVGAMTIGLLVGARLSGLLRAR